MEIFTFCRASGTAPPVHCKSVQGQFTPKEAEGFKIPSPGGKVARPNEVRKKRVGRGIRAETQRSAQHHRPATGSRFKRQWRSMDYPNRNTHRPHSSPDPFGATLSPGEGIFPVLEAPGGDAFEIGHGSFHPTWSAGWCSAQRINKSNDCRGQSHLDSNAARPTQLSLYFTPDSCGLSIPQCSRWIRRNTLQG